MHWLDLSKKNPLHKTTFSLSTIRSNELVSRGDGLLNSPVTPASMLITPTMWYAVKGQLSWQSRARLTLIKNPAIASLHTQRAVVKVTAEVTPLQVAFSKAVLLIAIVGVILMMTLACGLAWRCHEHDRSGCTTAAAVWLSVASECVT